MSHKIFNHSGGGDTRQILNNLREEDNLRREDKSAVPKVSSLRRFHCIAIIAGVVAIFLFIFVAIVIIIIVASKKYVLLITNDAIIKNLESIIYFDTDIGPLEVVYQPQLMRHMEKLEDREKRDMRWWTPLTESPHLPPTKPEEMYEVLSSAPHAPSQLLLTIPLPQKAGAEEDNVYDTIPGEQ